MVKFDLKIDIGNRRNMGRMDNLPLPIILLTHRMVNKSRSVRVTGGLTYLI